MSDNVTAIKGFADLFSPDSDAFTHMEAVARETFSRYGFTELRTPILERTELFCRGIGTETDVVQKEMYTFPDRKGRSLTLRPEATAGVMRAYIESGRSGDAVTKLFTIGPMFRYERPQKGRMRQFHQINCECLGPSEPYADAELVTMAMRFLEALGLKGLSLQLNSLGCPTCRPAYRETLRKWLSELDESALCEDCRRRMVTNPLRVLDCKVPSCKEHTAEAPKILDHNCPDCAAHFDTVRRLLDAQPREGVCVLLFGIDGLKRINGLYNRLFGDEVIRIVCQKLQTLAPPGGTVFRLDGDEFGVVLRGGTLRAVQGYFGAVQQAFSTQQTFDGSKFFCTLSCGCAFAPHDGTTYLGLLKCASSALDHAKRHGKNRMEVFRPPFSAG